MTASTTLRATQNRLLGCQRSILGKFFPALSRKFKVKSPQAMEGVSAQDERRDRVTDLGGFAATISFRIYLVNSTE